MRNTMDAIIVAVPLWYIALRPYWPWDWKGNRKKKDIVIKREKRPWE